MLDRIVRPWIHIWSRPNDVMRSVVEQGPKSFTLLVLASIIGVVVVIIIYAMGVALPDIEQDIVGQPLVKIPILIFLGSILGILFIHVSSMVASWTGSLSFIRGDKSHRAGNTQRVKAALAWSLGIFHAWIFTIALVTTLAFWVSGNMNGDGFKDFMFGFLLFLLLIWGLAWAAKGLDMVARCLAYAQDIPRDKAVSSLMLTFIITLPPFLLLWGILPFIIII